MERRHFLKSAGVVTILVAGGTVWRAWHQGVFSVGSGPAFEPWHNWANETQEGPLALVRAAILAASPHNTQPWLFKVTPTSIELYADTRRNLGTFDGYLREMYIGLGCAIENIALAATVHGYSAELTMVSGALDLRADRPEKVLAGRVDLKPGERSEGPLYHAIPRRHTNRGPFDMARPIPAEDIDTLAELGRLGDEMKVFLFSKDDERKKFGELLISATQVIIADAQMVHDSQAWFRNSPAQIEQQRDGLTLDAAGLPPLVAAAAKILPPLSAEKSHEYWLRTTREVHAVSSPLFGLIAVRDRYDKQQNLLAGGAWQRMHLWATTQNIAMQPVNQPLEQVDRERALGKPPRAAQALAGLTRDPSWQATFAFRAGYPLREAPASPRRDVKDVLL
jgi:hypothetical protein